tara:strand:- start:635 stop:1171 length:537 start_codon:yes stop_codon:yes gene_type:complete
LEKENNFMKLSKEIFNNLLSELSKTPTVNESEWAKLTSIITDFKRIKLNNGTFEHSNITNTKLTHYSFRNKRLNKIISDITQRDIKDAISLHIIEAKPPTHTTPHRDRQSKLTLNVLLEDEFEGGYLHINDTKVDGMRTKGDYILYNGSKEIHFVTPVTKGIRKTLVVWFFDNDRSLI